MTDPTPPNAGDPRPDPWAPPTPALPPAGVPAITPAPHATGSWGAPTAGPPGPPLVGPPASMVPGGEAMPAYVPGAAPPRRPIRTAGVAIAAALSLVAGVFGVLQVTAADGAGSPEGAVEALFAAIDQEDALGVVEALAPNERDLLLPVVRDLGEEADRLELTDGLDLADVQGVDLRVEGLELEVEELAPGVADVTVVGGTITGSARVADLPAGSILDDLLDGDDEGAEEAEEAETESLVGIRLVARRSDGWHVSALSSIAEQARRSLDPVPAYPTPDQAIPARGADSPEAAVRETVAAAIDLDVRRLIELSPPDEMAVLHEYGSILVDRAEDEVEDTDTDIDLQELELATSDGPDGTTLVTAVSMRAVADDGDGGTTTFDYRDGCATTTWESPYDDEGDDGDVDRRSCEDDEELGALLPGLNSYYGAGGAEALQVIVVERDGAWYVSPTRTITESVLRGVRALTAEDLQRFARYLEGDYWVVEPAAFWEACGVDRPADDAPDDEAQAAYDDCWAALPDDYDGITYGWDTSWEDDGGYDDEIEDQPEWQCYDLEESAEVDACLQDLVESGEVDEEVLIEHRCDAVFQEYYETDWEPSDEEWEALEDAYDRCVEDGGKLPSSTVPPAPTPTVPPGTPSTTVPATTVPPAAPSTTVPPTTAPAGTPTTTAGG